MRYNIEMAETTETHTAVYSGYRLTIERDREYNEIIGTLVYAGDQIFQAFHYKTIKHARLELERHMGEHVACVRNR